MELKGRGVGKYYIELILVNLGDKFLEIYKGKS